MDSGVCRRVAVLIPFPSVSVPRNYSVIRLISGPDVSDHQARIHSSTICCDLVSRVGTSQTTTMSDQPSALRQALSRISPAKSVVLILPFTPGILLDPSQLLATIYHTTTTLPTESLLVYFTTPSNPTSKTSEQLYDVLLRNPRGHWDVFQAFLSQVYATLTAAQWASGKVNLKVDVGFAGQHSDQTHRIMNRDSLVLYLEGMSSMWRNHDTGSLAYCESTIPVAWVG